MKEQRDVTIVTLSTWVGGENFKKVCKSLVDRRYSPPKPDLEDGSGAYALNIVNQYHGKPTQAQVLTLIDQVFNNPRAGE